MRQKLRYKISCFKLRRRRRQRIQISIILMAVLTILGMHLPKMNVSAESCPDMRIVFARGSGAEINTSADYLSFKNALDEKLKTTSLSYEFIDLDYPAIGVGIENLGVMLGAFFGGGEAYEFGESIKEGVNNLTEIMNSECRDTKYVLGGYSQGAMVLLNTLEYLRPEQLIYLATFGDPKIYLPEGEGIIPVACKGENLSDYRIYVPDCQAYKGMLGAHIPYEPEVYTGKMGTWCNKRDIFCSSHISISDHVGYVSEDLYEDASKVIFNKIADYFGFENHIYSPHDTAFLIDSTGSMSGIIDTYKAEALRLAEETLATGGRVALYEYRDLWDPYNPVEHCGFETCTLDIFANELEKIHANGGGDTPESLLSASWQVMNQQTWKFGATKSVVVLTDANYLSPDRDGITFDQVVRLGKEIDPVNFYIITKSDYADSYAELARQTGGKVVTNFDELSLLTDYIIERYDSLPQVEETGAETIPEITVTKTEFVDINTVTIDFVTTGKQTIVIVDDAILGTTKETEITISELNSSARIMLVPMTETRRGEAVTIDLTTFGYDTQDGYGGFSGSENVLVPKAPNTGRL